MSITHTDIVLRAELPELDDATFYHSTTAVDWTFVTPDMQEHVRAKYRDLVPFGYAEFWRRPRSVADMALGRERRTP